MTITYRTNMPSLSTDIIIEYRNQEKEGIVLIARKTPPYGLALHLRVEGKKEDINKIPDRIINLDWFEDVKIK